MLVVLPALIGALVGSSITSFFNLWKFHRDERASRCDELCKAVSEAASLALTYWTSKYDNPQDQIVAETKLRAAQDLFESHFEDFSVFMSSNNEQAIYEKFSDFVDALTGGEFTELGRHPDFERAKKSAPLANRINVHLRRSIRETIPFYNLVISYHKNKRRSLDMPPRFNKGC